MTELTPEEILRIQSNTVFSVREEEILANIPSTPANPSPDLAFMEELIKKHNEDFHSARTPQVLLDHWHLMNM
uniref:MCRS_N domain-containing protein n=1 Tax=Heterorhabditis bacteriophora TaxID=37862 RepID=A0A1I7XEJ5_HETBA